MSQDSTAVAPNKSFEERMMDRIRESIGDLMTDEDLRKIVERGVEKALFFRAPKPKSYHYDKDEFEPSFVDRMVKQLLQDRMDHAIREWMNANSDRVETIIKQALGDGIITCLVHRLNERFATAELDLLERLRSDGLLPRR